MDEGDRKAYLGDSVYVQVVGGMLLLTTENGGEPSNKIYLEVETYEALGNYYKQLTGT